MFFDVTRHNSPLLSYGSHGSGDHEFIQPCSITLDMRNKIYVMDTGNSRIKVLDSNFELLEHVKCPQLEGRSVTGLCLGQNRDTLVSVNWRTRMVAEMTFDGVQVAAFTHKDMVEPIAVSVTPRGEFVVVDTSVGVLLFDQCGKLIRKLSQLKYLSHRKYFLFLWPNLLEIAKCFNDSTEVAKGITTLCFADVWQCFVHK